MTLAALGRQLRRSELPSPQSKVSQHFGSWTAALEAFVNYANGSGAESPSGQTDPEAARPERDIARWNRENSYP